LAPQPHTGRSLVGPAPARDAIRPDSPRGVRHLPGRRPDIGAVVDQRHKLFILERPAALVRARISPGGGAPRSPLALLDSASVVEAAGRSHPRPPGGGRSRAATRTTPIERQGGGDGPGHELDATSERTRPGGRDRRGVAARGRRPYGPA